MGSSNPDQQQNFIPKKQVIELGANNLVVWKNGDSAVHFVTPDKPYKDPYSGSFGSKAIMPGKTYSFLFTHEAKIPYFCKVHPWMKGEIDIVSSAKTA